MLLTRARWLGPAVAAAVLASMPAMACHHGHGVSIAVGPLYLALGHHVECDDDRVVVSAPVVVPEVVMVAPEALPPPQSGCALSPVVYAPPMVVAAPAPVVVAPAPPPEPVEEVQRLAAKWMPAFSAPLSLEGSPSLGTPQLGQNFGVEVRFNRFWAVRGDLDLRSSARTWDVPGLKFTIAPSARLHPFVSAGLSLGETAAIPGRLSLGVVAAVGLDLQLFKYAFLTAEARYRTFPGDCCSLPRVTGLAGVGVSFL